MVRMIVPADVRSVIGQSVFKISTRETDEHRAVVRAAPIIAGLKERIRVARTTLKKPIEAKAAELAEAYRARQSIDPASAQAFVLTDVIAFVLQQQGHSWADYGRHVREVGYDAYDGLRPGKSRLERLSEFATQREMAQDGMTAVQIVTLAADQASFAPVLDGEDG
jgi:hypothetical protein